MKPKGFAIALAPLACLVLLGLPSSAIAEESVGSERLVAAYRGPIAEALSNETGEVELRAIQDGRGASRRSDVILSSVVLALGSAIAVVGIGLYAAAYVEWEEYDGTPDYAQWSESVGEMSMAGDVLVMVGALAFIGGLVSLILTRRRSETARRSSDGDRP